jgi:hypothetical protein
MSLRDMAFFIEIKFFHIFCSFLTSFKRILIKNVFPFQSLNVMEEIYYSSKIQYANLCLY